MQLHPLGEGYVRGYTCCESAVPTLRSGGMPANRMNRDEFYAAMAPHDDARLRKVLWTVYWRGNAQLRGDVSQAATLVTKCLKELPGHQAYLDFRRISTSRLRSAPSCRRVPAR